MEASAIPASVGLARPRIAIGASLLRIRTDEQLVTLFRQGNDEAFRAIHDRYRSRLVAYTRQMLSLAGQDPEDAVQEIFMRAYYALRADRRHLALRPWLYRIAHNRCIDDLRRPRPLTVAVGEETPGRAADPVAKAEQRDALRRLIADVRRLPEHQRSALLMRELSGMPYTEMSDVLGVSVPAVKSLLVRARVGLVQASEARDTACADIRADLILAQDRGVRTSGLARRHMRDCAGCRQFRAEVRGTSRQLAVLAPTLGPLGIVANLLGLGGGGGGAAAGGSAVAGGSAAVSGGVLAGGTTHVVTLLAAAVVTAGGAVELQHTLVPGPVHAQHVKHAARHSSPAAGEAPAVSAAGSPSMAAASTPVMAATRAASAASPNPTRSSASALPPNGAGAAGKAVRKTAVPIVLNPGLYPPLAPDATTGNSTGSSTGSGTDSSSSQTTSATAPGSTTTSTGMSGGAAAADGSTTTGSSGTDSGSGSSTDGSSSPPATSSSSGSASSVTYTAP